MLLRWLFPACLVALGLYGLRLSYRAYAKLRENLAIGDHSMIEAYEIEFWAEAPVSLLLIVLGALLAGRWSVRVRQREEDADE